jgi:2-iminobutanoate/2-iminopropanoate deaminase
MPKEVIRPTDGTPPSGAYSQGWRAGEFLFVTGTGPGGPDGIPVGITIEEQTERTIDNVEAVLRAASATLAQVIKVTVHLANTNLFERYDRVYSTRFSQPYPVRTTVGSDLGHVPGMLIEMDCVAYLGV